MDGIRCITCGMHALRGVAAWQSPSTSALSSLQLFLSLSTIDRGSGAPSWLSGPPARSSLKFPQVPSAISQKVPLYTRVACSEIRLSTGLVSVDYC